MKRKRGFCIKRKSRGGGRSSLRWCCNDKVKLSNTNYNNNNSAAVINLKTNRGCGGGESVVKRKSTTTTMAWDHSVSSTPYQYPSPTSAAAATPKFSNSFANRIFSDVAGDITIVVDGEPFLLHKFPLVARCGKIRKLVSDAKHTNLLSKLELTNIPGGPEAFELAAKFCYGMNFEITTTNVAPLRCVAEYLEMTEVYREENLIERTDTYLNEVVSKSLEKSLEVLSTCENLPPDLADDVRIPDRCINAIAMNACKEQLVSGLSRLDCQGTGGEDLNKDRSCLDWWVEDLSVLGIDFYARVISAMGHSGVRTDTIVASLMHYAEKTLKGIGKPQILNPSNHKLIDNVQKTIVESLVTLLPTEKSCSSVPLNFLFGMMRVAIMMDATLACRREIERRIALRLEMALLDDLLIPSCQTGDSLFDVDTIYRILVHFLQRIEEEECGYEENEGCGYESTDEMGSPSHGSLLKVGRLVDAYLAEIAPDPYLSLSKFISMIEVLPDYARVIDDGLYRAVDIYLKAHPMLNENESKKLCKFIDSEKLSQEACNHAAQNDRLPVHLVVRVLYFEQIRLKNALSGSTGGEGGLFSQKNISSGIPSAAMSPRDTYASLRRENRELKLEISRMRVRLSDLEKEQVVMKQGMMDKSSNGKTLLTSISKGIGRMGIFRAQVDGVKQKKSGKKLKESQGKSTARSKRYSIS